MNTKSTDAKAEIDRLTESFFGLFSNRDGARVDLSRIFDLFVPRGLITNCAGPSPVVSTLEEFIEPRQKILTDGSLVDFHEAELSECTTIFGNAAQRISTYRKSGIRDGIAFSSRGVKTFQFIRTSTGWWILSMAWDDERDGFSIDQTVTSGGLDLTRPA